MNPAVFHLLCLRQGDRAIEEYVSDFCGLCNLVDFNDMSLKGIFRNGLKDCLYNLMPDNACSVTLEEYINHALFLAGSSFTVEIADVEPCNPTVRMAPEYFHIPAVMSGVVHVMPATPGPANNKSATPGLANVMSTTPESVHVMPATKISPKEYF